MERRKKLILIDANSLIHRMYHALPPLSKNGEPVGALYGLANVIVKILKEKEPQYIAACFDRPEETFRKKEFKEYKAHRAETPDDLVAQLIRAKDLCRAFQIKVFEMPGYEADDLIGTLAERFKNNKMEVVILTGDLDETQLVDDKNSVTVETFGKGISELKVYDEEAVKEKFGVEPERVPDYKGLVGDSSDNISGVPGVGEKTAKGLLDEFGTVEEIYKNIDEGDKKFKKLLGYEKQAKDSKRLATIFKEVPVGKVSIKELDVTNINKEKMVSFLEKMGFNSLLRRLGEGGINREIEKSEEKVEKPKGVDFILGDKFDLKSDNLKVGFGLKDLVKEGLKGPYFDLGVGFWLLDADVGNYNPEYLSRRFMKVDWEETEEDLIRMYNWLKKSLDNQNLDKVFYEIEMRVLPKLAEMEERGIKIDVEELKKLREKTRKEIGELERKIYKEAGKEFNLNSPKQLSDILFNYLGISRAKIKKTAGGLYSTNYDNLQKIKEEHKIIPLILEYREVFKIFSTYIEPILDLADKKGRLHTSYAQTGTGTGRISSEKPNLQNIPHGAGLGEELRNVFVAGEGNIFLSFDYSQVELRILSTVAHDKKMIQAFKEGRDIHRETAVGVFGVKPEEVTNEMRRVAKVLNFGVIYGMGSRAFALTAGITMAEAKEKIEAYFGEFSAIRDWQKHIIREAKTLGYVQTLSGRRRLVPDIQSDSPRFRAQGERVAMNMPIQGLGADIMKRAIIKVGEEIEKKKWGREVKMLLTIHDDLLFEVKKERVEEIKKVIIRVMESAFALAVPLLVEVKEGSRWGEMRV